MPCNPKKDLSTCVAKTKVHVLDTRYFWSVYLWQDVDEMYRQTAFMPADLTAHSFAVVPDTTHSPSIAHVARNWCVDRYFRPRGFPLWVWDRYKLPQWFLMRFCRVKTFYWPKLGEIHFVAGNGPCGWSAETISHEAAHAAITSAAALGASGRLIFQGNNTGLSPHFVEHPVHFDAKRDYVVSITDEELFCYLQGSLFNQIHRWCWQVDPPFDARRSEWSL